ncbi:MAG: ABC transporter substrate-binding protein [Betaproteobacteria bacterium]|nr:ABC transporter substrate-binding protein [Betaproteobacteria bacterium]
MKKTFYLFYLICVAALAATPARAADKFVLQLKWVHQAQFAGYYAAQEKGFYAEENLEVEIRARGPKSPPPAEFAKNGEADVVVEWMPAALLAREEGIPLVNIAQPFKYSAAGITCLRAAGIKTLDDLRGKRIGHWPGPDKLQIEVLLDKLEIPVFIAAIEGGGVFADGVHLKEFSHVAAALQKNDADCITTLSYADPVLLADAGFSESDLITFAYDNVGAATLQDGLWVLEGRLRDKQFSGILARFVRASMRGWRWAKENQEASAQIVLGFMDGGANAKHQRFMMRGVAKLVGGGALDIGDYRRTADILFGFRTLAEPPKGAHTSEITDRAEIYE